MPNYSNGKIYKLVCDDTNIVYYGSTTQKLCSRLSVHTYDYNKQKIKSKNALYEAGNVKIILVEDYPCERKEQLLARERFYIENNDCINVEIPLQTKRERRQRYKEHEKKYRKYYHDKNKHKLQEIISCECGMKIKKCSLYNHRKTDYHIQNTANV